LGEVLAGRRAWRVSGADESTIDLGLPPGYPAAGAVLAVPLASPTRAYGWLCLADKIGASEFEAHDEEFLKILGAKFAQHYESARERIEAQRHVGRVYTLLSGLVMLIVQARTQEEVCSAACQLAVQHGGFQLAGIGRLKPAATEFIKVASAGAGADFVEFARELSAAKPAQENVVSAALRSGQPSICNDLEFSDSRLPCRETLLTRGYRAIVVLPLLLPGAGGAYLLLGSRESEVFDAAEMGLLREFSRGISLALDGIERAK
jgi:GAF domain-containing protein